ncbi:hypothetical protein Q1695_006157 [Nippostrongylus brasiliensis]|nr:hypothetical protein Q1695_006157 [Nippostrongylus brasiliensis]
MGDQGGDVKESAAEHRPEPAAAATDAAPQPKAQAGEVLDVPGQTARFARIDNLPRIGRRVSSVEAVKGAPPPKRQSVVVFETPDTPIIQKPSSWWRNLVMDDDKTAKPISPPEIKVDSSAVNGGLDERNRNISSASVGDSEFIRILFFVVNSCHCWVCGVSWTVMSTRRD